MKNAYTRLHINMLKLEELRRESSDKADKLIAEQFGKLRIMIYGDKNGEVKYSNKIKSSYEMNSIDSIKKVEEAVRADLELIISYDKICSEEKRRQYDLKIKREKERNERIPKELAFLKIDSIDQEIARYVNSVLTKTSKVETRDEYSLLSTIEPENEELKSEHEIKLFDKRIAFKYMNFMQRAQEDVTGSLRRGLNTGKFESKENEIKRTLEILKVRWAYEKIKDRDSRKKYNVDRKYELNQKDLKKLEFYAGKKFGVRKKADLTKYIIDREGNNLFLKPVREQSEEIDALKQRKKVIYLSREIGYTFGGAYAKTYMEEYTIERVINGELKVSKVLTDGLSIISMASTDRIAPDREYSNFTLGTLFSDESIDGCTKHRFGYIGMPAKNQKGEYKQYFENETLQASMEFQKKELAKGV